MNSKMFLDIAWEIHNVYSVKLINWSHFFVILNIYNNYAFSLFLVENYKCTSSQHVIKTRRKTTKVVFVCTNCATRLVEFQMKHNIYHIW